jgi:sirohydrochlorin cobaltochelatase
MTLGIVLFAHGSRDPLWSKPIETIAHLVAKSPLALEVRCAYLELMEPTLETAVTDLASCGVDHIRVTPMFLGIGKHARNDLPEIVKMLRRNHPNLTLELMPSISEHPELIGTIASILTKIP